MQLINASFQGWFNMRLIHYFWSKDCWTPLHSEMQSSSVNKIIDWTKQCLHKKRFFFVWGFIEQDIHCVWIFSTLSDRPGRIMDVIMDRTVSLTFVIQLSNCQFSSLEGWRVRGWWAWNEYEPAERFILIQILDWCSQNITSVCVCVCVCMFMWFMRTQIRIMTWVWHRYYKEKVIYEDIFSVPIIQKAYKSYIIFIFLESKMKKASCKG